MRFLIALCLTLLSTGAFAETLTTDNYVVVIKNNCPEGFVVCRDVSYTGLSKRNGTTLKLRGSTWHRYCADGETPCRFLGYRFFNKSYTYLVHHHGLLEVLKGRRTILEERGEWTE